MLDSIYFPSKHLDFSRAFFRIQAFDRRAKHRSVIPNKTIYLPLPNEIFSQNFTMSYSTKELGAFGEVAARNFDSVAKNINGVINNGFSSLGDFAGLLENAAKETSSTLQTQFTDSLMSGFGSLENTYGKVLQGFGYTYAPNKTQIFEGVTQYRTFVASWDLYPRSYQDAKNIEEIFSELLTHSLPKLEKNTLLQYIKDGIEAIAGDEDLSNLYSKEEAQEEEKPKDGDTSQKATNDQLEKFYDTARALKSTIGDVFTKFLEGGEFYPTTFEVPNAVKLSIMERKGDDKASEMEESFHFPYNFYIQQLISNVVGNSSDQNASFIEYKNEEGETEYFPVGRKLVLYLVEERPLTASDFNHRREYENA